MLWTGIHWQFSSFYMQTACLMQITLRARSDADMRRVQKRKRLLLIIEYATYALIVTVLIVCIVLSFDTSSSLWNKLFHNFAYSSDLMLVIITSTSMYHIHKHSKAIEDIGIKTNSALMKAYAVGWIGLNLFGFVYFSLRLNYHPRIEQFMQRELDYVA